MSEVKTNKITSLASNNDITLDPDGTGNTIIASGEVGVGTTTPATYTDYVSGSNAPSVVVAGSQPSYVLADTDISGNDGTLGITKAGEDTVINNLGAGNVRISNNGAERLRVDSSGNVGIGTTSPDHTLTVSASSSPVLEIEQTSGGPYKANLVLNGNDLEVRGSSGTIEFYNGNNDGASSTERMRIDSSGEVIIGATTTGASNCLRLDGNGTVMLVRVQNASDGTLRNGILFRNASDSTVGVIQVNSSSTNYATSSDYRLKENVADMTGAIDRVKALAPKRFNFIIDPDTTVDGFLAHEAQAVVPEAITGTHNEVDDDGNAVMQGIDQSKLVPLLTAALKESITKIETLETEMTALKARVTALEDA